MDRIYSICEGCEHFSLNNDDRLKGGCRAFSRGIPNAIIGDLHSHDEAFTGYPPQVGDYVYKAVTDRRINRFERNINIYQY